jgi:hypothetical protein
MLTVLNLCLILLSELLMNTSCYDLIETITNLFYPLITVFFFHTHLFLPLELIVFVVTQLAYLISICYVLFTNQYFLYQYLLVIYLKFIFLVNIQLSIYSFFICSVLLIWIVIFFHVTAFLNIVLRNKSHSYASYLYAFENIIHILIQHIYDYLLSYIELPMMTIYVTLGIKWLLTNITNIWISKILLSF